MERAVHPCRKNEVRRVAVLARHSLGVLAAVGTKQKSLYIGTRLLVAHVGMFFSYRGLPNTPETTNITVGVGKN